MGLWTSKAMGGLWVKELWTRRQRGFQAYSCTYLSARFKKDGGIRRPKG